MHLEIFFLLEEQNMIFHKHPPRQQQLSTLCVVCIAKIFVQEDEFYFKLKTVVRSVSKASSKRRGEMLKFTLFICKMFITFSLFKLHQNAQMFYFLGRWQIEKNVSPKCFLLNVKRRTWKVEKKIILKEKKNDGKNDII